MNAQFAEKYITKDEYYDILLNGDIKYEWYNGMMWPVGNPDCIPSLMAGAQPQHNQIKHNIERNLGNQLEESPCFVHSSDGQIKVEETDLLAFPDILVGCEDAEWERERGLETLLNPHVLVEILSPTTENFDRGNKWAHYQLLPSLTDYLIVFSTQMRVEHFARNGDTAWTQRIFTAPDEEVVLSGLEARLRLAEIYRRVEFDPTLRLLTPR